MMTTLNELNTQSEEQVTEALNKCCVSVKWAKLLADQRPYTSSSDLIAKAASIWYSKCGKEDYLEAFKGHPKIGDVESLKQKFAHTKEWAGKEQAKVDDADMDTLLALKKANSEYESKFGYIFIVSASGKSAEEMLAIIQKRLLNLPEEELRIAMNEQHKITVIRLIKLIEEVALEKNLKSHITTHALDTAKGIPAVGLLVSLKEITDSGKKLVSTGVTNSDGRVSDLLPPGRNLKIGEYEMVFETASYQKNNGLKSFYPQVQITFSITDKGHYHIPLLISPYGFSTYKGS
ncbi:2-oxo-4-hydroxy-4-carboxy-5-ureidoimidazoline decarboxylase [uncultured Croceitalea sp.]|uniref:2-oxo-4-hydroxy-4-carboxy-5-ureidoimidazoline decarboxylase n=1 Tax=uncultured Croceitalea sp. TaxID=1798908 RepID=UPI00374E8ADE